MAYNEVEAFAAARSFGRDYLRQFYVKAQVQRTARSKGFFKETNFVSGIHKVSSPEEVRDVAGQMCGKHLLNKYTQPHGMLCRSVLVMEEVYYTNKFFISLTLDINSSSPMLTYSKQGGHPLDRLIRIFPGSVRRQQIDFDTGIREELAQQVAEELGLPQRAESFSTMLKGLYRCFTERDCLDLTLNPIVLTDK